MKLTIFDVCVPMQDQEQCDRMKQVCVDNGLPINTMSDMWIYDKSTGNQFYHSLFFDAFGGDGFCIFYESEHPTPVTEAEFLTLLNEYKKTLE